MLHNRQEDNYQQSSENIEKYLRVKVDDSQLNRLCVHYGQALEDQMQEVSEEVVQASERFKEEVEAGQVVYAMFDGCMLPTRPHREGHEEFEAHHHLVLFSFKTRLISINSA